MKYECELRTEEVYITPDGVKHESRDKANLHVASENWYAVLDVNDVGDSPTFGDLAEMSVEHLGVLIQSLEVLRKLNANLDNEFTLSK